MESMTERIATPLKFFFRVLVLLAAMALLGVMATAGGAAEGDTTRVSVDSSGKQANDYSSDPSISSGGRFVAFHSAASDLVANDSNNRGDVFVRDRQSGTTERVSVDSLGNQANGGSYAPSISSGGRFVAFSSYASDLVANDTNDLPDVFVHDRQTGTTERVSVDSSGNQANDGLCRFYACGGPSISANGRFVAFISAATNLVANDTNGERDVFVHNRQSGTTQRVSVDSSGNQANDYSFYDPSISSGGRFVAFSSFASNLVANDTNDLPDVFVHDRQTGTTQRVSVDSSGNQANMWSSSSSISSDGRFVAFGSLASNLVANDTNGAYDIFLWNSSTGTTQRVSVANSGNQANGGNSFFPSISADGRFVAFSSDADDLVANDSNRNRDVFVHDRQTRATQRVSVDSFGNQANQPWLGGSSDSPSISADGRFVAFHSLASDLVANDTNESRDIFVHVRDTTAPKVRRVVPTEGATDIALKADLVATFSERMEKSTLTKANFKLYKIVRNSDGTTTTRQITDVTVTPSFDGLKATLNPFGTSDGLLAKNARYKAVVSTGALDVFGNRLDQKPSLSGNQPKVWFFKTRS